MTITTTILLCGLALAVCCAYASVREPFFRYPAILLLIACVILAREAHVFV